MKVLEISKYNNFYFGIFLTYVEEIGENLNGISQIQNKNWISESSKKSSIFRRLYLQIYWESDKTLNNKVVDLHFLYKFVPGQISSAVQILSEKSTSKSPNLKS